MNTISLSASSQQLRHLAWSAGALLLLVAGARIGYYIDLLPYLFSTVVMLTSAGIATLLFCGVMLALALPSLRTWHTTIFLASLPLLPCVAMCGIVLFQLLTLPHLYDVTTNLDNPPEFLQGQMLRTESDHSSDFPPENAALQASSYPDITPLYTDVPASRAFMTAWETTNRLGWGSYHQDAHAFILESTHKPLWFGAKEDIVITIVQQKNGKTRIDLRSASRRGFTDLGANAHNIRAFIAAYPAAEKDVTTFVTGKE